jgi:hypothetical protein
MNHIRPEDLGLEISWQEPNPIDNKKRMKIYISMLCSVSWKDAFQRLREIEGKHYIALAINDMPEVFRMKAVRQLKSGHSITVENILTTIQMYRTK